MTDSPFFSRLDVDARRLLEDRRLAKDQSAGEKLALLRRLQGRFIECNLPRLAETRVEQSFNEQLFAKVLDYATLFSHNGLPFHVRPKSAAYGRYDDFSLGFFFGGAGDRVIASAELKGAGISLDRKQSGYDDESPVAQALATARGFSECRWAIVCNYRELRLYDLGDAELPLCRVDLLEVRDRRQLAFLCAHFDRSALLGHDGKGELMQALSADHPSAPVASAEHHYRIVMTAVPSEEIGTASLAALYDLLRALAVDPLRFVQATSSFERQAAWRGTTLAVEEGWCVLRQDNRRYAVSAEGHLRFSVRHPRLDGASPPFAQVNPIIFFWSLVADLVTFFQTWPAAANLWKTNDRTMLVSVSMREVCNWHLHFDGTDEILQSDYGQNGGICALSDINVGPIVCGFGAFDHADAIARIAADLALYFADATSGDRVRFDHSRLARSVMIRTSGCGFFARYARIAWTKRSVSPGPLGRKVVSKHACSP